MVEADARSKPSVSRPSRVINTLGLSLVWSACCAALAAESLFRLERFTSFHASSLLALFALGGTLAWITSAMILALVKRYVSNRWTMYALALMLLATATLAFTSGLFALQYRSFYAQWHEQAFSRIWILQFMFTCASAVYQFLVIGIRHYFPLGLPLLLGASGILVRSLR